MSVERMDFDGEIVVVVDDEYWMDHSLSAVVTSRKSGKSRDFSAKAVTHTLAARLEVADLKKANADSRRIARAVSLANYLESSLKDCTDPELIELIMEGRLQVAFLLNSGGGDGQLGDIFMDMMDDVTNRDGENQAYATSQAHSAVFDNMAYADRAFLLDDSILGWHLTRDADSGEVIQQATEKDLDELLRFIERAEAPYRQHFLHRIDRSLHDPANPDGKVLFYGCELALAGCVERGFDTVRDMQRFFGTRFWSAENPKVRQFWEDSVVEEPTI